MLIFLCFLTFLATTKSSISDTLSANSTLLIIILIKFIKVPLSRTLLIKLAIKPYIPLASFCLERSTHRLQNIARPCYSIHCAVNCTRRTSPCSICISFTSTLAQKDQRGTYSFRVLMVDEHIATSRSFQGVECHRGACRNVVGVF